MALTSFAMTSVFASNSSLDQTMPAPQAQENKEGAKNKPAEMKLLSGSASDEVSFVQCCGGKDNKNDRKRDGKRDDRKRDRKRDDRKRDRKRDDRKRDRKRDGKRDDRKRDRKRDDRKHSKS